MIFIFGILLIGLSVYSYSLIDPNITFFQMRWWEIFREKLVYFGYYQRDTSWITYLIIVVLLFIFHYFFVKNYRHFNSVKLALITGVILLVSYPLLSHDFL